MAKIYGGTVTTPINPAMFGGSGGVDFSYIKNNFANALKRNKTGKVVSLNDVSPIEHKLNVKLRTKNILPYPYIDIGKTKMGLTYTGNDDETVTISGTTTELDLKESNIYFYIFEGTLPKGTYTLSADFSKVECSSSYCGEIKVVDDENSISMLPLYPTMEGSNASTFTLTKDCKVVISFLPATGSGTTFNGSFTLQLEQGETATSYIPYNPDFSNISVSRTGKNLVPIANWERKTNGSVEIINNKDGTYTINGENSSSGSVSFEIASVNLKKGGIYTLSGCMDGNNKDKYQLTAVNGNIIHLYNPTTPTPLTMGKQTDEAFGSGSVMVKLYIYPDYKAENLVIRPQLEIGDTVTDFEPYVEPQTVVANADGIVDGLTSIPQTMILESDSDDVRIECEYNLDISKSVINDIEQKQDKIVYDFDETYIITEEEATVSQWVRNQDLQGNPIRLTEMQVDFTIPVGSNIGVQYLYFNYESNGPNYPNSMRVTEFAYQNTTRERRISVLCYKVRDSYYAVKGYAWTDGDAYTAMQTSSGTRMNVGNFFDDPNKILVGCNFTVNSGTPAAGTIVRIRGKRA